MKYRLSWSGLRSSPCPLNLAGSGIFGGLRGGTGSAIVLVSGSGGGGGGSPGLSGGGLLFQGLSGVSGNAPGCAWLLKAPKAEANDPKAVPSTRVVLDSPGRCGDCGGC